jgi:hypothetical protein
MYTLSEYEKSLVAIWKGSTLKDVDQTKYTLTHIGEYSFARPNFDYVVLVFRHGEFAYLDGRNAFNALLVAYDSVRP